MNGNYAFVVDRDSADVAGTAQRPLQVALLGFGTVGRSVTRNPYYLRFVVRDAPGILASIASALAREGINLDAVLQDPGSQGGARVRRNRRAV